MRRSVEVPGPRQPHRRRGLEHPAVGPGLGKRRSPVRVKTRWATAIPASRMPGNTKGLRVRRRGEIERERHGAAGSELCQRAGGSIRASIAAKLNAVVGDHTHGAADHQPAGRAEKSSDHRVGDEADGAAGAGEAEPEEQECRSAPPNAPRRSSPARADHRALPRSMSRSMQRHDQRCRDRDGGAVRPGDGEGKGAARRDEWRR